MIERVRLWVTDCLEEADIEGTCYVARTRRDRRRMRTAVEEGIALEVAPRVFAEQATWNELSAAGRARHSMRALQAQDPSLVFAGPSAACAYGLAVSNRFLDKTWVATTRRAHRRARPHEHCIIVTDDAVVEYQGLRLTSFARTVADSLRLMDFRSGLALADSVVRGGAIQQSDLAGVVSNACPRMRDMARARAVLLLADGRAESGGESIARATMLELGFALPALQWEVEGSVSRKEPYRVDFAWFVGKQVLLAELDGFEKYVNPQMTGGKTLSKTIDDEHRRQSLIEARDDVLRVIRFGFADVMRDWDFLDLLTTCGVPRTYAYDREVLEAGGILRCRD